MSHPHLTTEQVGRCLRYALEPGEMVAVYEHLDRCDSCRAKALPEHKEGTKAVPFAALQADLLLEWSEPEHLFYDQIAEFVDGTLDSPDREIVESHLQTCASCRAETARVQALHDLLASIPVPAVAPVSSATLRDLVGEAMIDMDNNVRLSTLAKLPRSVGKWLRELVMEGLAAPVKSVQSMLNTLSSPNISLAAVATRSAHRPTTLQPASTAIRSPQTTLRWKGIPGAQEYRVTLVQLTTGSNREVIWKANVGAQTRAELPEEIALIPGKAYLWQVTALVAGQPSHSPYAGFAVLSAKAQQELEKAERECESSALALLGLYEAYGLYEEALAQAERLADLNPTSSMVQSMHHKLLEQMGRAPAE